MSQGRDVRREGGGQIQLGVGKERSLIPDGETRGVRFKGVRVTCVGGGVDKVPEPRRCVYFLSERV